MGAAGDGWLSDELERWRAQGLLRDRVLDGRIDGVDFGSNDYLALARDPAIVDAIAAAAREYGAGGRSARLLKGGSDLHEQAERAIADWLGAEAALMFPSGYQANVGLLSSLAAGPDDLVLSDRENHASIIDGLRLKRPAVAVFAHNDVGDLERALRRGAWARRRLVVTEGVFSMSGERAPLGEVAALCERHDADLVVDEAHSLGLLGPGGAGAVAASGLTGHPRLLARVVTGGKALAVGGAFVVGSARLRDYLIHAARSFMFTTAPPPAIAGGLLAAIRRCREADGERAAVLAHAVALARELGLPPPGGAIVPFPVATADAAVGLARRLAADGCYAPAVRPPSVPDPRLRLVVHADHSVAQRQRLAALLRESGQLRAAPVASTQPCARELFVAGTDTGVGKTVVSAVLLRAARRLGEARYWKPVQTGDDDDTATVRELADADADMLLPNFASYELPASPHEAAAHAGGSIDIADVRAELVRHRRHGGELLVEFAGGLHVPYSLDEGCRQIDLLRAGDRVVVAARSGLGTLNHSLLTCEALQRRGIRPLALFLVGPPHPSNFATLARGGLRVFELPMLSPLGCAAIDAWLERHDQLRELFADD